MVEKAEGALSRWSRLKQGRIGEADKAREEGVQKDAPGDPDAASVASLKEGSAVPSGAPGEEEVEEIREEDLPDIDGLTYDSDFTVFMQKGVPEALRQRALAKLWASNPILAVVDGLNDYDLDYTIKEFEIIASESAEDLLRGKKRESAHEQRRRERDEMRRPGARRDVARENSDPQLSGREAGDETGEKADKDAEVASVDGLEGADGPRGTT